MGDTELYERLGVSKHASFGEIKRVSILKYHGNNWCVVTSKPTMVVTVLK